MPANSITSKCKRTQMFKIQKKKISTKTKSKTHTQRRIEMISSGQKRFFRRLPILSMDSILL